MAIKTVADIRNMSGPDIAEMLIHMANLEDEVKVLRAEKALLDKIIPLIPDFNPAIDKNPAIANYDYLKYRK